MSGGGGGGEEPPTPVRGKRQRFSRAEGEDDPDDARFGGSPVHLAAGAGSFRGWGGFFWRLGRRRGRMGRLP